VASYIGDKSVGDEIGEGHYRFDLAAQTLYDFVWKEYCDWYLELSKPVLTQSGQFTQDEIYGTRHTLLTVLEEILRVMHPFMPFITEHMWHKIAPYCVQGYSTEQTIMLQPYPEDDKAKTYVESMGKIERLKSVIEAVRQTRSQNNISPKIEVTLLFRNDKFIYGVTDRAYIKEVAVWLKFLLKVKDYSWLEKGEGDPNNAQLINLDTFLKAFMPLAGLIDLEKEKNRLKKEIEKAKLDATAAEKKLANPNYVDKAPPLVVAQERERLLQYQATVRTLEQRLKQLEDLKEEEPTKVVVKDIKLRG
jgi:valyl-tRNA synthetase